MTMIDKIESFRQKRRMSMQELVGSQISHSTYSRFISGKSRLAADTFIYLLENLNLSFQELSSFDHEVHQVNNYKLQVQQAIQQENIEKMEDLKTQITPLSKFQYDSYHLLIIRLDIQIDRLLKTETDHGVVDHLNNVNNWTFKELYLFQLYTDYFDSQVIRTFVKQQIRNHPNKSDLERNINLILFLHRTSITFLERREIKYAKRTIDALRAYIPELGFTTMRFCYVMDLALLNLALDQSPSNLNKIRRLYRTSLEMDCPFLANELAKYYRELEDIYQLPPLDFEAMFVHI